MFYHPHENILKIFSNIFETTHEAKNVARLHVAHYLKHVCIVGIHFNYSVTKHCVNTMTISSSANNGIKVFQKRVFCCIKTIILLFVVPTSERGTTVIETVGPEFEYNDRNTIKRFDYDI